MKEKPIYQGKDMLGHHQSMHQPMDHKAHLEAEHQRHSHRMDHEKVMHGMTKPHHLKGY